MSKQKLACRGYEAIVYPSDLDVEINREYEILKCVDRRRKSSDLKYLKNATLIYPHESWNDDIPDDESYNYCYNQVRISCLRIIDQMEHHCEYTFHYAFNLHDQDMDFEGRYIKNHFHVYIWTDDDIKNERHETYMSLLQQFMADYFNHYCVKSCKYLWHDKIDSHVDVDGKQVCLLYNRVNLIKYVHSALKYLIHADNHNKFHYKLSDCVSDLDLSRHKAFVEDINTSKLNWVFEQIRLGHIRSFTHLIEFASANDILHIVLKYQWVIHNYIESYCGNDPLLTAQGITSQTLPEDALGKCEKYAYNRMIQEQNTNLIVYNSNIE